MKKKVLAGAILSTALVASGANAVPLNETNIDFGIQYRVMYNNSNIGSTKQYDFFRQRLRLNLDVHTEENVGGFLQIEYRGGWGGSSPGASDPRNVYAVNAFNRLQARGIRYGFLYFPAGPGKVLAGILPANDQVDQMLFSADWDLNVGGVAYAGAAGGIDWRAAYVRLIEGQALIANNNINKDQDEHFIVLDVNSKAGGFDIGAHWYGAYGKVYISGPTAATLNQTWLALTGTANIDTVKIHGAVIYNTGKIGSEDNNGFLVRIEPSVDLEVAKLSLLGAYSSGGSNSTALGTNDGFHTVHSVLGTAGYWAYTYIFTPHGPSDVNDFGLEPGNRGYGLTTLQAKVDVPITDKLSAQAVAGYFRSNKDVSATAGKNLGTEFGAQLTANVGKNMNLEFGGAIASLGDAAKAIYQKNDKSSVNELFARLQLEF